MDGMVPVLSVISFLLVKVIKNQNKNHVATTNKPTVPDSLCICTLMVDFSMKNAFALL